MTLTVNGDPREFPSGTTLADLVISEADRLSTLADRLLHPRGKVALRAINMHEIAERARALIAAEAGAEIKLERDYDPSLPSLTVDPNHIIQAMLNLGRNAIQALAGSTAHPPRLILRTRAASNASVGAALDG